MPYSDAIRWNTRYQKDESLRLQNPRQFLVENTHHLPKSGYILDLAMGMGNNAAYLTSQGFTVIGVDIAFEAVRFAKSQSPGLMAIAADTTNFPLTVRFDGIINFYYCDRLFWKKLEMHLNPGGVVIIETLTRDILQVKPEINPEYLLGRGELLTFFNGWEILKYREGWVNSEHGSQKAISSIVARLSGSGTP